MRADHSWPQRRQLYQATTQVLSGAGSTGRPQTGHDIVAVAEKVHMTTVVAMTVPLRRWPNQQRHAMRRGRNMESPRTISCVGKKSHGLTRRCQSRAGGPIRDLQIEDSLISCGDRRYLACCHRECVPTCLLPVYVWGAGD